MNKGEIVLLKLPEIKGHEQFGLRPAIIISKEIAGMILVIPLTTNSSSLKYSFTININSSKNNGLELDSIALIFQLRAIDKRRIKNKIGVLEDKYILEINKMIKEMLLD